MIKNLIVSNFRNFSFFKKEFEKINIIAGKNGAGKTNLIEAIYFCLNGHPFSKDLDRIKIDKNKKTLLNANVDNHTVHIVVESKIKRIKLDGKPARVIYLKRNFPCIDYSINSFISFKSKDYIFSLIDRGIFASDQTILDNLIEYKKLMKTKRELLRSETVNKGVLDVLNTKLFDMINTISKKRKKLIETINAYVDECYRNFHNKKVNLQYSIGHVDKNIFEDEVLKRRVILSLKKDTLKIEINGMDIFPYSSVGEKKVVLLCIVLAIVKLYNSRGLLPVFLIDDLEGDLDKSAQQKVFETIVSLPNQLFITTLGAFRGYNTIELTEDRVS